MAPPLRMFTLGSSRLADPEVGSLRARKDLALLAYLARRAPRAVPRAELAALLWGDREEERARHSLRTALLHLRRAVGNALETLPDTTRIVDGALQLDATTFERDMAAGRLADAAARWEGDFLPDADDLGGEEWRAWLEAEREGLRRRLAWALERLVDDAGARGEWTEAVRWAERWTGALPLDERASRREVEALRLARRPDEALARHAAFTARYRDAFGRDPPPDHARLAERLRDDEPRSAGDRYAGRVASPGSAARFAPDFVGRSAQFAELTAAWEDTRRGATAVVVVEGDEGIGKTRLCEELVRWVRASAPDAVVLHARAYEAERDAPWIAARHLLAPLADAPGIAAAPPPVLAQLADTVLPALHERFRALPNFPPAAEPAPATAEALARALAEVAAEAPVLLCLDDFPAADAPTQTALRTLVRRPPPGVLQLYTGRPEALEVLRLDPDLRDARAHRVRLRPLEIADVEAMVASMLEMEPGERHQLAERLHAEGGGNPFYITELVAGLMDAGLLVMSPEGTWRLAPEGVMDHAPRALPLPARVREAVRDRIGRLSDSARMALEAAAVLGRRADARPLAAVAGLPAAELAAGLDELVARRLLREFGSSGGDEGYEFAYEPHAPRGVRGHSADAP